MHLVINTELRSVPCFSDERCPDVQETQVLEAEQARLRDEIVAYEKEKSELEFILDTHRAHCGPATVGNRTRVDMPVSADVGVDRSASVNCSADTSSLPAMGDGHFSGRGSYSTVAETAMVVSSTTNVDVAAGVRAVTAAPPTPALISVSHPVSVSCRPTSLPALSSGRSVGVASSTVGVNLLTVGLDSLADGHTGLTPLTGIPSGPVVVVGMPVAVSSASSADTSGVVGFL